MGYFASAGNLVGFYSLCKNFFKPKQHRNFILSGKLNAEAHAVRDPTGNRIEYNGSIVQLYVNFQLSRRRGRP